jgi:hypothetical protein
LELGERIELLRKTVSGILFVLLLVSVFTGAFNVQSAKANASSRGETVQAAGTDWWPMFHHDLSHTGYSTSTGPTTNNTLWTYTTGAGVESSPAVVGGLVYVGSWEVFYCLNAATGALVWSYYMEFDYLYSSSPAVVGGFVYVGSYDGVVYCLDAATGALVWGYLTGSWVWSSPAVVGGFVYVGSDDGNVYCLNAATGAFVWSYHTWSAVYSSPAVVGGFVYVGSCDYNVYCLNATTGSLVWSYLTGNDVYSSPAVVNGVVYVGSNYGKIYAFGPVHDVAVTNVTSTRTVVGQGFSASINVTAANQGDYTETFNVTAYANTTIIATLLTNITLTSGNSTTITFTWNTTGFAKGNYTISAYATPVTGETDIINNNCTDGWVLITKVGDLGTGYPLVFGTCDGKVTGPDLALFLMCYKGTAPPEYKYLGDLGTGYPLVFGTCDGKVTGPDLALFLMCYKGTAPTEYKYLGDLGTGYPLKFFACDGKVTGPDLALFLMCYKGLGP